MNSDSRRADAQKRPVGSVARGARQAPNTSGARRRSTGAEHHDASTLGGPCHSSACESRAEVGDASKNGYSKLVPRRVNPRHRTTGTGRDRCRLRANSKWNEHVVERRRPRPEHAFLAKNDQVGPAPKDRRAAVVTFSDAKKRHATNSVHAPVRNARLEAAARSAKKFDFARGVPAAGSRRCVAVTEPS